MSPSTTGIVPDFYPRPPGGGRHPKLFFTRPLIFISIHALRVEGDLDSIRHLLHPFDFYPRPPGGGRQRENQQRQNAGLISIHALRVEGDQQCPANQNLCTISIHALRVEGDSKSYSNPWAMFKFLSTPSGWRATKLQAFLNKMIEISIHALRVEGDAFRVKRNIVKV